MKHTTNSVFLRLTVFSVASLVPISSMALAQGNQPPRPQAPATTLPSGPVKPIPVKPVPAPPHHPDQAIDNNIFLRGRVSQNQVFQKNEFFVKTEGGSNIRVQVSQGKPKGLKLNSRVEISGSLNNRGIFVGHRANILN